MAQTRTGYPSDESDEEWALCAPYLVLLREDARQRVYRLRSGFNAVRYLGKAGCGWRMVPNDVPPWPVVQQQTQRWIKAGCFERLVHNLREVLRVAAGREAQPTAVILASRTGQSTPSSGERAGLHRLDGGPSGCRSRAQARGHQTLPGQARLRPSAQTLARRTILRLGGSLRLFPRWSPRARLRLPQAPQIPRRRFMTASRNLPGRFWPRRLEELRSHSRNEANI
jgi:transposase